MLNKAFTKKKKWITGAVASGLALAIVATGIYQSSEAALAKASLPKIEKYNQENGLENPFTILEIAPSYADAKIGYLVNGQEPAYYDENGVKAIADMGSAEERKERYSTNSASFGSAPHNFSAFSDLNGKAFDYSDFDETSSDTKTKSFTTYGEFKQVATGTGDYLDLRNLDTTYVQLGTTSVTMTDVLKLSDDRTQHSLYSDDVVFEFRSAASTEVGYKLTFQEYSAVTDNTVRIPFKTVADYDTDVAGDETLFNWFYYLKDAKIAPVKTDYDTAAADYSTEHPNGATAIYTLNNTFPQDKITAIYRKYNGDSYTYMGYVFYDSTDSAFKYQPVNGSAAILVSGEDKDSTGIDQTTWASLLIGDTDEYYTIRYYSDLNDSDRMNERLYVSQVEKTTTTDVDANGNNLAAVSATVAKKTIRISAGDEPSERLISIEDPLTYHVFYYLPSTTDEFAYYYDDDATTRAANKAKTTHNFVSDFTKAENETIKYNGGFTNKEWFKQYVLDLVYNATDSTKDECSKSVVDVITKLPSDVTADDITNADLIYIQGGNYTVTKDMTTATAKALVESIGIDKPIVVEGELLYDGVYDSSAVTPAVKNGSDTNPLTNLYTLVFALEQSSLVDKSLADYITDWDTLPTKYANSRLQAKNQSYTNRTVFVFNGDSQVTGKSIVCADFVKTLSGDSIKNSDGTVIYDSYKEVREDISQERFYLNVAKSTAEFNEAISIATCIRHIISFGDRRVTSKDALRVLDIEPFYSPVVEANPETLFGGKYTYKNSNGEFVELSGVVYDANSRDIMSTNWIKKYIGTQIADDSKITIKGMGTREFVSNIQDLNETYDLIYIGLDTQYLNTDINTIDGKYVKSNKTVYNDSTMDGLVYTHIGDLFNGDNAKDNKGMATKGTNYRGSGNDLTFEKTRELQSYVEAGYAVIFSDDFFVYDRTTGAVTGVNNATIDEKSYMHDFAQWVINNNYIGKNVSVKKNFVTDENVKTTTGNSVVANREDFKQYLSISKLNVEIIDNVQPQAYYVNTNNANVYSTDNYHYLKMNSDGVYTLDFKVKLTNDAAVDTSNTTYDCKLFIDHDADGRYEDIEALNGLIIKDANNNDVDQSLDNGAYKFHLTTGTTYSITRRVPDGYVGFLPWKLVFYENNRIFATTSGSSSTNLVKTAIEGYSAIYDTSDRPEINILQITSGNSLATNLNLKETKMEQLYQEVKDFEIKVDQVSIRDLIANDNNAVYTGDVLDYLMNYDMLVLGFADSYYFWHIDKDDKVVWALRQYTLSGRSILYTHDLNSTNDQYIDAVQPWGTLANKYLRDVQGMDRYGVTASQLLTLSAKYGAFVADYKSRYDNDVYLDIFGNASTKSTKNGSLIDRYGWNNTTLLRYHYTNKKPNGYGDISIQEFNGLQHTNEYVTDKVTRTNKGQITEYPFHIPEEITVADTHPQYFQLNLDTDTKDTNYDDDIVVWYTISNQNNAAYGNDNNKAKTNYYTFDYNDARNNYYIYNKGNITYTGAGHSSIGADREDERRLFVNTLVAAYNAGDHAPIAKFRQYPREMANDIDAMYEPFDVNLRNAAGKETGGYIEENVSVYFKTVNNNLQNNAVVDSATGMITYKTINAQYYVEAKEGDAGAIKIGNDYYKIIVPVSMKKNVNSNGIELTGDTQNVTSYYALDNYSIYTVEFDIDDLMTTTTSSDKVKLDKHNVKIFIRLSVDTPTVDSTVTEKYTDGTTKTETRQGMNHSLDVLPGSDSLNELTINFTELYELK